MKIENTGAICNLDIKRCYLPIVITDTCPHCGATVQKDLDGDYISYPRVNAPFMVSMHHIIEHPDRDEEHDWKICVVLRVTMEPAPPEGNTP